MTPYRWPLITSYRLSADRRIALPVALMAALRRKTQHAARK